MSEHCPECDTPRGAPHRDGCDVERCSVCLGQRLHCLLKTGGCAGHDPQAEAWAGEWPGRAEALERGWWAVRAPVGWRPCPPGTPGAIPDLNRLTYFLQTGKDELYRPSPV